MKVDIDGKTVCAYAFQVEQGLSKNLSLGTRVGRTAINDYTDPSSILSDGSAGGLNISNVGFPGDTISFDVTSIVSMNILSPTQTNPEYAGSYTNPTKITLQVETTFKGLPQSAFSVKIGGQLAKIIIAQESSGKYTLDVTPPAQSSNGLFGLVVELSTFDGLHTVTQTDTEVESVNYTSADHVDVELVIDRSGSIGSAPMSAAQNAAKQFVDFMQNGDKIGVVSFADDVGINFPLTTIESGTKDGTKSAIDTISSGGGTSIGGGLSCLSSKPARPGYTLLVWEQTLTKPY